MRIVLTLEVDYETLEGGDILDPELADALVQQLRSATGLLENFGMLTGDLPAAGRRHRVQTAITEWDEKLFEVPTQTLENIHE